MTLKKGNLRIKYKKNMWDLRIKYWWAKICILSNVHLFSNCNTISWGYSQFFDDCHPFIVGACVFNSVFLYFGSSSKLFDMKLNRILLWMNENLTSYIYYVERYLFRHICHIYPLNIICLSSSESVLFIKIYTMLLITNIDWLCTEECAQDSRGG